MKVGALLAAHALRAPDRIAVSCGGQRLTYRELDARSVHLANALIAHGLRSGDRVVLYLDNGVPFVELFVAVLRAGGLVVPVSTRLIGPELAYIVADCSPFAIAFEPGGRPAVGAARPHAPVPIRILANSPAEAGELSLEALAQSGGSEPPPTLPVACDDAMITYTSGTTGFPRGAVVTHANLIVQHYLMNSVEWQLSADDRFLVTTPLAHRTGLARLLNGLLLAARVVIMPRFDPAEAVRLIEAEKITVMGMVPTVARMLVEQLERAPAECQSLRVVLVTGEAFPVDVKRRLATRWPHVRTYSFFAMTEAGSVTSLGPAEQLTHPSSVGRVSPGVEVRLIDDKGDEVATGEVGEILVRCGEPGRFTMMRAYYGGAVANAEIFLDGWLRTGDLGYFDADSYLHIVDRKKDMILSGGLNIYSKEVERALLSHAAVADVAVIGVPDARFGEAVMAFVVTQPGTRGRAAELIEHCRGQIASYKKPKYVRFVESLPRNSLGKVLKEELRRVVRAEAQDNRAVERMA